MGSSSVAFWIRQINHPLPQVVPTILTKADGAEDNLFQFSLPVTLKTLPDRAAVTEPRAVASGTKTQLEELSLAVAAASGVFIPLATARGSVTICAPLIQLLSPVANHFFSFKLR